MCMSLERYQKMSMFVNSVKTSILLVALNSKNNGVPTDFHLFLDKAVCSSESKMCMFLERAKCNESVDIFSIFLLSEEQSEDIKF